MPAITSIDEFLELVRRSGAIDPRRLDGFVGAKYGGQPPDDPQRLAEDLVASNLLSRYHTEPLLAGRPQRFVLSGKYRIIDRLGAGGMASVFLCEHKVMRRRVAIKMLPPSVASNPAALDRFHREARAMAGVHHPNIVGAHDVDQDGKIHFIVMEYVEGTNFHELIRRAGPLSLERAAYYIAQAAKGLQHAHDKGLVHRDIKPANLLIDRSGTVKILDLGLALVFHADDDNLTKDHDANSILGTAEYLAPEQAVDSHAVDHRADIYSLGMTLYFLLAAQTPFGEGTTAQKLIWHQLRQPKPIRDHRPDLPEELWTVLSKMLTKDANERYQSMRDVAEALSPWTGNPIPLPSDNEMPKQLEELQGDFPLADSSAVTGSYANPGMSLPTPLDAAGQSTGGRGTKATNKPNSMPSFALPGGLEAAIPTPPVASAPTAPSRPAPSMDGRPSSQPAVTPSPVRPAISSDASPSGSSGAGFVKAGPVASTTGIIKKIPAVSSGTQKSLLVSTVVDEDDEDAPKAKPKSKKFKKKETSESNKGNKGVLIAVGAGGVAALIIGGLVLALSGGPDTPPTQAAPIVVPATTKAPPKTTPATNIDNSTGSQPAGVYRVPLPDLVNVAVNGKVVATPPASNSREGAENLIDGNLGTKYFVNATSGINVQFEFADGKAYEVRQYGVATANDAPVRDPKSWEFSGSNDEIVWEILDTRANQNRVFGNTRQTMFVYDANKVRPYKFYRLSNITNSGARDATQFSEWALYANSSGLVEPKTDVTKTYAILEKIEAEQVPLTNARARDSEKASGGKKVANIDKPDSAITFRVMAEKEGPYRLVVHYANGKMDAGKAVPATQRLMVNDNQAGSVTYKPTGGWDAYEDVTLDINLKSGENVLKLIRDVSNADLDYVQLIPPPPPSITEDYLPTVAQNAIYYDLIVNKVPRLTNPQNPWAFFRQIWNIKEVKAQGGIKTALDINISPVLYALGKTAEGPPNKTTEKQGGLTQLVVQIRNDGQYVRLIGPVDVKNPTIITSEAVLKLGAMKGETWTIKNAFGDDQIYKLDILDEIDGKWTAVVKTEIKLPTNRPGTTLVMHVTYKFVKGVGEIERMAEREVTDSKGKEGGKALDYILRQR